MYISNLLITKILVYVLFLNAFLRVSESGYSSSIPVESPRPSIVTFIESFSAIGESSSFTYFSVFSPSGFLGSALMISLRVLFSARPVTILMSSFARTLCSGFFSKIGTLPPSIKYLPSYPQYFRVYFNLKFKVNAK